MGMFSDSVRRPLGLGRTIKTLAAVVGMATLLMPGISLACDDDYPAPTGWAPYPAQQPIVVVDPRAQYDGWRRERAARAYWYWRGRHREHERESRHHHRGHWD